MPKYEVLEKSFINNTIAEVGEIVVYDGTANANLKPVEDGEDKSKKKFSKE